jgi:hypothetical protein
VNDILLFADGIGKVLGYRLGAELAASKGIFGGS